MGKDSGLFLVIVIVIAAYLLFFRGKSGGVSEEGMINMKVRYYDTNMNEIITSVIPFERQYPTLIDRVIDKIKSFFGFYVGQIPPNTVCEATASNSPCSDFPCNKEYCCLKYIEPTATCDCSLFSTPYYPCWQQGETIPLDSFYCGKLMRCIGYHYTVTTTIPPITTTVPPVTTTISPQKPDLITEHIVIDGDIITYVIKNIGTATASSSTTYLYVDGAYKDSSPIGSINAGSNSDGWFDTYRWVCSGVNDVIKVCADATNSVTESDETNNCREETFTCPVVTTTVPKCPTVDGHANSCYIRFDVTMRNLGIVDIRASVDSATPTEFYNALDKSEKLLKPKASVVVSSSLISTSPLVSRAQPINFYVKIKGADGNVIYNSTSVNVNVVSG